MPILRSKRFWRGSISLSRRQGEDNAGESHQQILGAGRCNGLLLGMTWKKRLVDGESQWCRAEIDEVRANLSSTGYEPARMHFLKGRVQDTLPDDAMGPIALLRLDTDWYESTKWELEQLYPQLAPGGVLIIDDYGRWRGCRKAVDEYFAHNGITMLLGRIDSYARMGVKV